MALSLIAASSLKRASPRSPHSPSATDAKLPPRPDPPDQVVAQLHYLDDIACMSRGADGTLHVTVTDTASADPRKALTYGALPRPPEPPPSGPVDPSLTPPDPPPFGSDCQPDPDAYLDAAYPSGTTALNQLITQVDAAIDASPLARNDAADQNYDDNYPTVPDSPVHGTRAARNHHRRQLSTRDSELQHELRATIAYDLTLTPRSNLHIHTDITTYSGLASFIALDLDSGPGSSWVLSMRDELDRLRHPVLPTDLVTHADPGSLGTHADDDHYSDDDDYSDDSDDDMPPLMDPNDDDYSNLGYTFVYPLPPTPMNE